MKSFTGLALLREHSRESVSYYKKEIQVLKDRAQSAETFDAAFNAIIVIKQLKQQLANEEATLNIINECME